MANLLRPDEIGAAEAAYQVLATIAPARRRAARRRRRAGSAARPTAATRASVAWTSDACVSTGKTRSLLIDMRGLDPAAEDGHVVEDHGEPVVRRCGRGA